MANFVTNNRLTRYFRESYLELQKVVWPTADTVRKHTILVLGISLFIGIYFAVLDYVLTLGVDQLI